MEQPAPSKEGAESTDAEAAEAEALAMVGLAKKLEEHYPPLLEGAVLARFSQDMHELLSHTSNSRLRRALDEGLSAENLAWDGTSFHAPSVEARAMARLLDRVADTCNSSRGSKTPLQQPCDERGKTAWLIWRANFVVDMEYAPIKAVGKGAYGVVCSARHVETGTPVAIKRIGKAFENLTDARRALREVKLLRHLRHDNVIKLLDIMRPPRNVAFNDVYLVYELMETDLAHIIRSPQSLSNEHHQYFIYQILRGLKYIHSANVLHRDLKPGNLLLTKTCQLKICDFGLARTGTEQDFMTEYVVTRWYRAPELLLSCDTYGPAIDVWSVGCILAELLGRTPLFPGKDYVDQLKMILRGLGAPSTEDLLFISSQKARQYIQTLPDNPAERIEFETRFPGASADAIDLLQKMLCFDPRKRITVVEALEHRWLSNLHDIESEVVAPGQFHFEFENTEQLTEGDLRTLVLEEIRGYHPHS